MSAMFPDFPPKPGSRESRMNGLGKFVTRANEKIRTLKIFPARSGKNPSDVLLFPSVSMKIRRIL
jgi:hypothetical protein